jgi:hypothetical protein
MRRRVAVLTGLLFYPLAAVAAQNAPAPYTSIGAWEVPIAHSARFEEGTRGIVDAAQKAKLKHAWGTWQNDNTYAFVADMQKIGELDDPMRLMRQFDNTPGQALLVQAFQKFNGLHLREEIEVLQFVPEWSYTPANLTQQPPAWVEVFEYWQVAGSDDQFDKIVKDMMSFLKTVNYPFMVLGNRTPVGRRRSQFVVVFDDPAKFAAEQARLERNAQYQALGQRLMAVIFDMQTSRWRYRPELSYNAQ